MYKFLLILLLAISGLNAQITGLSGWNIFLDPGHSRTENMGICGYSEAEEVLRTALNLREMLLTQTDIDTVWSARYNDNVSVSLWERTQDANNRGAAWYHSIHSNAGAPSHNNVLLLWGELYDGTPDPPVGGEGMSNIMIDLLSDVMRLPSIGSRGDCSFYSYTGACDASWPGPYLYVNRNTSMPSELSEQGHHSNPLQNQLDMNEEYKRMMAYSMFWTILDNFGIDRPFPGILAGIITNAETGIRVNGVTVQVNGHTYTTDTYESLFNQYTSNPNEYHNGFYYFENLPDSSFELVVSADGFYTDTLQVESLSSDFVTFLDVNLYPDSPPIILSSDPAEGDTNFVAWDNPQINFNRTMDTESLEAAFSIEPHMDGTFSFTQNDKRMTFRLADTLEALADYIITIAGTATDLGGHQIDGNQDGINGDAWVLSFRTAALDTFPPLVAETYPLTGQTGIEVRPVITVAWDEELDPSTISPYLVKLERVADLHREPITLTHHLINDQTVMLLHTLEELLGETEYQIHIMPGIQDPLGNSRSYHEYFNFTTSNTEYITTSIDDFESDPLNHWWEIQQSGSNAGIITELVSRGISTDHVVITEGSNTSLQINYGWNPDASSWLIREHINSGPVMDVLFTGDHLMQAYVFGDGNGNHFRFCVDDNIGASTGTEVSPWFTIDWLGWRLITWDMPADGTGTWIGDGSLDGTLRFDSIQLSYTSGNPNIGSYFIDELRIADQVVLALDGDHPQKPQHYALLPNYPNPFNPWTTIPFTLPEQAAVQIKIFNLRGEEVAHIFSGSLDAGRHLTRWNAAHVSSGLYLVKMDANDISITRKITILK